MNHSGIYKQATTPQKEITQEQSNQKANEATRLAQVRLEEDLKRAEWLNDRYTQRVLNELREFRNNFNSLAINLSTTYHTHNNHQQIIQLLQQVATIDNLLATYGRTDTNNSSGK